MIRRAELRETLPCAEPVPYEEFRPGFTWADVREMLAVEQRQKYRRGEYMWIGRSTVLGRMHQLKKEAYENYLDECAEFGGARPAGQQQQKDELAEQWASAEPLRGF